MHAVLAFFKLSIIEPRDCFLIVKETSRVFVFELLYRVPLEGSAYQ